MMDSIVYLVSNPEAGVQPEVLIDVTLKQFLIILLGCASLFAIFICVVYSKLSTNYERARAEKQLSDNNKEHEELRQKHFKIRDKLIYKDAKNADNIRILKQEISRLEGKVDKANKEKDDAIFASKRRAEKIRKMEEILRLESPQLQLNNLNRSMASIIKSYKFPENI